MGNCLVTKLKGSVDNPLLPKIGEVILEVNAIPSNEYNKQTSEIRFATYGSQQYKIEIIGGNAGDGFATSFADLSDPSKIKTSETFQGANSIQSYYFTNGNYHVRITNIYMLYTFSMQPYGNNIQQSVLKVSTLNVNGFVTARQIDLARTNAYGDIRYLPTPSSLVNVDIKNSQVTGSVEEFVQNLRKNRETGSIELNIGNSQVTFNGETIVSVTNFTLSWKASTITYNGVTINA